MGKSQLWCRTFVREIFSWNAFIEGLIRIIIDWDEIIGDISYSLALCRVRFGFRA